MSAMEDPQAADLTTRLLLLEFAANTHQESRVGSDRRQLMSSPERIRTTLYTACDLATANSERAGQPRSAAGASPSCSVNYQNVSPACPRPPRYWATNSGTLETSI